MSLQFEWDPKKAEANLVKHKVSFEAAITVLSIYNETIPPTINTVNVDPELDIRVDLTLGKPVKKQIAAAMTNSFGFGGQNASIVFRKLC